MKKPENLNIISNKCKIIIKSNNPEKSIMKISNLKLSDNNSIGKNNALNIYKLYSNDSTEYNSSLYRNKITLYKDKISSNVSIASKFANK